MKLATYRDGSRDGQLVVVSRDLSLAHIATGVATRLQQVLDDWNFLSPQLEELSQTLNHGKARHAFDFDPAMCMAPLPRAYLWAAGPALRPGDELHGARDPLVGLDAADGMDFGAGLAAITGDVALGTSPEAAIDAIRLLVLVNDVGLREARPPTGLASAFGPVAVTPDELSGAWSGGRVHLNLECARNGKRFGLLDAGDAAVDDFGVAITRLCRTRRLRAGSIVGTGPLGAPDADRGHACIAAKRALEASDHGAPRTAWLQFGDSVRLDMKGGDGLSVFGAIEQRVQGHGSAAAAPDPTRPAEVATTEPAPRPETMPEPPP